MNIHKTVRALVYLQLLWLQPTKTLSKMANRYAKKKYKEIGVYCAIDKESINPMLEFTQVQDVWGIGTARANFKQSDFETAADVLKV